MTSIPVFCRRKPGLPRLTLPYGPFRFCLPQRGLRLILQTMAIAVLFCHSPVSAAPPPMGIPPGSDSLYRYCPVFFTPVPVSLDLTSRDPAVSLYEATSFITFEPGFTSETGANFVAEILASNVPDAVNDGGNPNSNMNWTIDRGFDAQGRVIGESKNFFDNNGKIIQTQFKVFSGTSDPTPANRIQVMAMQPIYDALGRPAISTLPAPINNTNFNYRSDFASGYNYTNFDGAKTTNPDAVTDAGSPGTLGWYYGQNNNWEPYQDATLYPYARSDFYSDGSGKTKRVTVPGDTYKLGSGRETQTVTMPAVGELTHYFAVRTKFFPTEAGASPAALVGGGIQNIAKDANGTIGVEISDKKGNALMDARPGSDLAISNSVKIGNLAYSTSLTFSSGTISINANGNGTTTINTRIYQSPDQVNYTQIYSGPANGFAGTYISGYTYTFESDVPFTVLAFLPGPHGPIPTNYPATQTASSGDAYFFQLLATSVVTITGGTFTLYNMLGEQTVAFTSGGSLAPGYYKVVNTGNALLTLSYSNGYSDISYNFYNQLGQVIASISPEGVKKLLGAGINNYSTKTDLPFTTLYSYDLNGRLISVRSADAKQNQFIYRQDGKIRFSQNAEQVKQGWFSYTNYDPQGRAIESGEFHPAAGDITFNSSGMLAIREDVSASGGFAQDYTTKRVSWTKTTYDVADNSHGLAGYTQDDYFLRNAISTTQNPNSKTWYNYDDQGRGVWVIQQIAGLGFKTIDYSYDPVTGMTQKVTYQKGQTDQFLHYYVYDDDIRMKEVRTNTTDDPTLNNWAVQARYYYYLTGQLKRTELGGTLQGIDYTYNIQGLLKSINQADKTKDPGNDAVATNGFQPDAIGLNLEYYSGDYKKTFGNMTTFTGTNLQTYGPNQFTGSARAVSWFTKKPAGALAIDPTLEQPTMYAFQYDQKYQYTNATWGLPAAPDFTPQTTTNKESITGYDGNGNIKGLSRTNAAGTVVDNFTQYNYLNTATGLGDPTTYNTDELNSVGNYGSFAYNDLGQLKNESLTSGPTRYLQYDVTGKVTAIYTDAAMTLPVVTYAYNEGGLRIIKRTYVSGTSTINTVTYYVYDEVGNEMALYTQAGAAGTPALQEQPIYAQGRIGVYNKPSNDYQYELTDNLGNVRSVIHLNSSTQQLEVLQYSDYYPYGSVMRSFVGGTNYRYGYQGQNSEFDNETNWNAFLLRDYDSRVGRWLSVDPKGEFYSPYEGMGNDPVNSTDPDGGCSKCDAQAFAASVNGTFNALEDGRYTVQYMSSDGALTLRFFGQKLSTEVMLKMNMDVLMASTTTDIDNHTAVMKRQLMDFADREEAENLQEMLLLSRYQRQKITLVGEAIDKLNNDDNFKKFEQKAKQVLGKGDKNSYQDLVGFGGERGSFKHLVLLANPNGTGWMDPDNIKTLSVASNELTWMVRNVYVTATVSYHNGVRTIDYSFVDTFDLVPDSNRSFAYRAITGVLGFVYHKMMGNSAPKVYANWSGN